MPKPPLNPDAPRIVLKRLVTKSAKTQKAVAREVGEREDTFSKILNGVDGYELKTPLMVQVIAAIDFDFEEFARLVREESEAMRQGVKPQAREVR